jgi:dipeptidyl aminopeptidase/acylaminoacyl peptidase
MAKSIVFRPPNKVPTMSAARIPLQDFFKNPAMTGFQISPDGNSISFMQPYRSRMNVFVQSRATGQTVRVTGETERDVDGHIWKGPNRIVYSKDFMGDENYHLVSVDSDGRNLVDLTPFEKVRTEIIDARMDHDDEMIVRLNKRNPEVFDAYRLDLKARQLTQIAENPGNITGWITDHDGRIRVAVATDGVNSSILYREDEMAPFKTVVTTSFRESIQPLFFSFDNRKLYAISNIGRDKSAIVLFDPATAREEGIVFQHRDVDVWDLEFSRRRKVLTEVRFVTWKRERKHLDARIEAIYRDLESRLPGYEIDLRSCDRNESIFIVAAWNDRTLGVRHLYDATTRELTKIAEIAPWLDENQLVEMKPISYQSRDGLTIHGYLTLPRNAGGKLPLIVTPHGGPWSRNEWGYDPEVQFLANRGYAVLQTNFRGSTGYGRKFWESGFKQWGKTMQDDVSDAVHYAIGEGIADPKRVCIYGVSYGGYAALAGLAFTPELYACGVDFVGVSNLFTFMKTIPPYWKPMLEMLYEMVGHPDKDKALLAEASPALHADKIRVPLFIAQGEKDPRVNIEESNQMVAALGERGIAVDYMVKENEGHGFLNEENRLEFYEAMEKFLEKHLREGP